MRGRLPMHLSFWKGPCSRGLSREIYKFFWDTLFNFFLFHFLLLDGVSFYYSFVFLGFLFSQRSHNYFWFGNSTPSLCVVCHFSLLTWRIFLRTKNIPISRPYIHTVCFQFFFVMGKMFDVVHVHQVVDIFRRFTEFVTGCAFPKGVGEWHQSFHK